MKRWIYGIGFSLLAATLSGCGLFASPTHHTRILSGRNLRWKKPPAMSINVNKTYVAHFATTAGDFQMTIFAKQDPVSANNFIFLANHHFFNGDTFFRLVKSFIVQAGDPLNLGTGGPGYSWNGSKEQPTVPYGPGIVAMANSGSPTTNGSQFFICTGTESELLNQNPVYTELGRITQGLSVVQKISDGKVKLNPYVPLGNGRYEKSRPIHPVTIENVTIDVKSS
jgi:cyclophilin family peptidyl-prolyl cis-trans isomerase